MLIVRRSSNPSGGHSDELPIESGWYAGTSERQIAGPTPIVNPSTAFLDTTIAPEPSASLDPLSAQARNNVAEVLRHARRCDEAILQAQRALELNPHFGRAHSILVATEEFRRSSGEAAVFAYIVFRSRAHRDRVNTKVMKEMAAME
jgi:hypothetical protein